MIISTDRFHFDKSDSSFSVFISDLKDILNDRTPEFLILANPKTNGTMGFDFKRLETRGGDVLAWHYESRSMNLKLVMFND